jgi:predicted RNase H-like nuclease (RuvC/YqgF family)
MEENKKSNNNKLIIIALAILLVGVLGYTFYQNNEYKQITEAIEAEKSEIELNLDSMIIKYEEAIAENTSMADELAIERDKIIALRDSVKDLKAVNYSLINRYRKQIEKLEASNKELFAMNEELSKKNELLSKGLDSANATISSQRALNDTLTIKNVDLSEKVAIGSILKVNAIQVLSMREKNNGKLVETQKAGHTDAFRINFTVANNAIAEQGEREVYIQILDPKGNVIGNAGELVLIDGTSITYSDRTIIEYLNQDVSVISLIEVNRDALETGVYTVNIFVDDMNSGVGTITLK